MPQIERFGGRRRGGVIYPPLVDGGEWEWTGWVDAVRMHGVCDDRTNAFCALVHMLDPDESEGEWVDPRRVFALEVLRAHHLPVL